MESSQNVDNEVIEFITWINVHKPQSVNSDLCSEYKQYTASSNSIYINATNASNMLTKKQHCFAEHSNGIGEL